MPMSTLLYEGEKRGVLMRTGVSMCFHTAAGFSVPSGQRVSIRVHVDAWMTNDMFLHIVIEHDLAAPVSCTSVFCICLLG